MGDVSLKIIIEAVASKAIAAFKSVIDSGKAATDTLKDLGKAQNAAGASAEQAAASTSKLGKATASIKPPIKDIVTETQRAEREIKRLDKEFGTVASGNINQLKGRIQEIKETLSNFSRAQIKSSLGAALTADLAASQTQLKTLEKQANISGAATGNVFQKIFGSVRQLAYILPGVGIAGIFSAVIAGAVELVKEFSKSADSAKFLRDKMFELNAEVDKAQASTAGERAELQSLVSIASNEALSRDARTEALKKLQQLYPAYFTNVKLDGTLTEKLKQATDKLTQSILLNAKAKAIQKQIDESAERVAKANNEEQLGQLDKAKIIFATITQGFGAEINTRAELGLKNFNKTVKDENELQKLLAKQLTDTNTELAKQGTLFNDKPKKTKTGASDEEQLLARRIAALKQIGQLEGGLSPEQKKELISLEVQLNDIKLPREGFKPEEIARFDNAVQTQFDKFLVPVKITTIFDSKQKQSLQQDIRDSVEKGFDISKAIKKEGGFDKMGDAVFSEDVQKSIAAIGKLQDKGQQTAEFLTGTLKPAFDDVFQSIIKGGQDAFQALSRILVQILSKLVLAAIEAAIFAAIITAVSGGTGTSVLKGGFGTQFKSLFSGFGGPKLAGGGIVSGPTSGFPATLHGTEAIIPINQLNRVLSSTMGGGQDITLIPSLLYSGDSFRIMLNQVDKRKKRV